VAARAVSDARRRDHARRVTGAALLLVATAAIAWLPTFGTPRVAPLLVLVAVAGASFLALATQARRGRAGDHPHFTLRGLFFGAVALRLAVVAAPPWLSDERWHVTLAGGVLPDRSLLWKAFVAALDVAFVAWLLRRVGRERSAAVLLYAWNPLVVITGAGSGHVDTPAWIAAVVALDAAARPFAGRLREVAQGALAGAAAIAKPLGFIALLGAARWETGRRGPPPLRLFALAGFALALVGAWIVLAGNGPQLGRGLASCTHDEGLNGLVGPTCVKAAEWLQEGLEALSLRTLGDAIDPERLGGQLAAVLFLLTVALLLRGWRGRPLPLAFFVTAAYLATTPVVHPWHVAWLAPFLPLLPWRTVRFALLLTVTSLAACATALVGEPPWVALVTWLAPCALFAFDSWRGAMAGAAAPPESGTTAP
jgi:hypothetical protein